MLPRRRIAGVLLLLAAVAAAAQSMPDPRDLIRRAAENDKVNQKRTHDYMYTQRAETRRHRGSQIKTETQTNEVFYLYGERVERRIAKDDQPLSASEAAKEEERIAKLVAKRQGESAADRQKRQEKFEKREAEAQAYMDEIQDAYNFSLQGSDSVNGRAVWVIAADPRPGYRPKLKQARFLPKVRFRAWIDQEQTQWIKLEAEVIDDISFGVFLAKVNRGTHVTIEAARINDEVWLPSHIALTGDARLLLKHVDFDSDVRYSNYRKFRTDSRIVGFAEEPAAAPATSTPPPPR